MQLKESNKMKNKLTVSIGIPAYNEEANIGKLLEFFSSEKEDIFQILEIIVISDGSTDNTVNEVKKIKDKRIKLIIKPIRQGKPASLNKIFSIFIGDILITIDADCIPKRNTVNVIAKAFNKSKASLIGGNPIPLNSKGILFSSLKSRNDLVSKVINNWNNGDNVYASQGRILALENKFAKKLKLPSTIAIDSFLYFTCKYNKKKFIYLKDAKVYFRLPRFLNDHIKQSARFNLSKEKMVKIFGRKVKEDYKIPTLILFKCFMQEITVSRGIISYLFLNLVSNIIQTFSEKRKYDNALWKISYSTKK